MNRCPRCGNKITGNDTYCAECGYRLSQAYAKEYYGRKVRYRESSKVMIISFAIGMIIILAVIVMLYVKMIKMENKHSASMTEIPQSEKIATEEAVKEEKTAAENNKDTTEETHSAGDSISDSPVETDNTADGYTPDELMRIRLLHEIQKQEDRLRAETIYKIIEEKYYYGNAAEMMFLKTVADKVLTLNDGTDAVLSEMILRGMEVEELPVPEYQDQGASLFSIKITAYGSIQIYTGTPKYPDRWKIYPVTDDLYIP